MENKLTITNIQATSGWDNEMLIGNGRLGAMISGNTQLEAINLNTDSLWCVPYMARNNPDAQKYVGEIRELLRQGNVVRAEKLLCMAMSSLPKYFGAYEPMCQLRIFYNRNGETTDYKRELDIENGMASVDYINDGLKIHREGFVSYEYQTFVYKIKADKPELDIHFHLMRRPEEDEGTRIIDNSILHMSGQGGRKGIKFDCMVSATTDGKMSRIGDFLGFEDASEITIYVTANTDFYYENPKDKSLEQLKRAMEEDYEVLKSKHIKDFSSLYNRVSVNFSENNNLSVDERLDKLVNGEKDNGIFELLFNYARYLMISASRPGSQAMNLQGIWNWAFAQMWECNYTININTQMNYWIAESTQLSDCHEPLFELIERMVPNGERAAKELYNCDGFVAHHATNVWGDASINGIVFPSSIWPVGGAWLIKHMWEHYLYTGDKEFLEKRAFPIMKKQALFYTQYMTKGEDGFYESGPSLSPENCYITENGDRGKHCMGPEMDHQIIRSLFRSLISTYEILDCCDDEYEKYKEFMGKIRPTRINKKGGIMEWDKDYKEVDPGHRHISPLFALHPDYVITPEKTPEFAEACETTINSRLGGSAIEMIKGFSYWNGAWLASCYSKLKKGDKALAALYAIVNDKGRLSNSLLVRAPIFQIDASFGIAAAVVEMLLYSDEEYVEILPALPTDLEDGSFKGLCARGGFEIDAQWKRGKLISASVTARFDNVCRIKAEGISGVDAEYKLDGKLLVFNAKKGEKYQLSFKN